MKHLFVPYEIAVIAKEKGFNEDCLAMYNHSNIISNPSINPIKNDCFFEIESDKDRCSAPLYQQLIDWFREKHKQFIIIIPKATPSDSVVYYQYVGVIKYDWEDCYEDYYEALNKALEEAFKLI
jgi:hypothetical protein